LLYQASAENQNGLPLSLIQRYESSQFSTSQRAIIAKATDFVVIAIMTERHTDILSLVIFDSHQVLHTAWKNHAGHKQLPFMFNRL